MRHQQATAEAPAAEEAKGEEEKVETLYVTGSRLKRLDLDTPAPVTIVTKQQIEASGLVNIGEVLQQLPQVGGTLLLTTAVQVQLPRTSVVTRPSFF